MLPNRAFVSLLTILILTSAPLHHARAETPNVGLGAALGASFSSTKLREYQLERTAGNAFSWGFFVDIPLTATFYITPAATIYELNFSDGYQPVTDIDLAFKFIAPIGPIHLGAGFLVGPTAVEKRYLAHIGALAHLGLELSPSVDVFAQFQYKHIFRKPQDLDDLHGYLGVMLRL